MAKLDNVRHIVVEDFPTQDQQMIGQLSVILNYFMDNVVNLINGTLGFDNLYQELVTFTVTVDSSGIPKSSLKLSTKNVAKSSGGIVISAINNKDSSKYPISCPFVSFTSISDKLFQVNNITGLQADQEYSIILLMIGK
jgi:hypothetical protein